MGNGTRKRRAAGALIALAVLTGAAACSSGSKPGGSSAKAPVSTAPCSGANGVGGAVPTGLGPGDLVGAVDLTPQYQTSSGFPTNSRVFRVLYVSTGVDESDLQLVCGLVAVPTKGPAVSGGRGRMIAWSHGTIGMAQNCLPSSDPAANFWGPMPGGIGAIAWGDLLTKHQGKASDGLLQYAMNQGWVVAASDYQPDDTYIVGKIAAANQLDVIRAGSQLMSQQFKAAPSAYDLVVWGHSQGGHAAMWTGQLAQSYLTATHPSRPAATFTLKGIGLLAPATNFVTQPARQPGVALGDGLVDWEMHQTLEPLGIPLAPLEFQIGPALFSYVFGSWSQLSARPAKPAPTAQFPAYPVGVSPLSMAAVVTTQGAATVKTVLGLCLSGSDAKKVMSATSPYRNAKKNQMLVPPIWNLPAKYSTGQYFKGAMDATCAKPPSAAVADWCQWVRFNLPGPLGDNPYPKSAEWDGKPVPLFIGQGSSDTIIHCSTTSGTSSSTVPQPADCMSRAFYDSLASAVYCPAGHAPLASLQLDIYRKTLIDSPASHLSIPGEASAKGLTKGDSKQTFAGSPMQQFMTGAFTGALPPGCSAVVKNP